MGSDVLNLNFSPFFRSEYFMMFLLLRLCFLFFLPKNVQLVVEGVEVVPHTAPRVGVESVHFSFYQGCEYPDLLHPPLEREKV